MRLRSEQPQARSGPLRRKGLRAPRFSLVGLAVSPLQAHGPAHSGLWDRIGVIATRRSPRMTCRSVRQRPTAAILTSTSVGCGASSSIGSIASGDPTLRKTAAVELAWMKSRPSQHVPGQEVPEENFVYRFAKKHWFFGFGAYT